MLTAADSGRTFFEILDADRDGRLGRRELRDAAKRLKPFDRDGDGRVRLAELPRTYQFASAAARSSPTAAASTSRPTTRRLRPAPARRAGGLLVPPHGPQPGRRRLAREFLGTPDDFRKLDADGDGLIDDREAAKGP